MTACVFGKSKTIDPSQSGTASKSIYDIQLKSLDGNATLNLADYKGKKILIVNTASKCGYTPQYAELQQLQEKYADKLVIIGCPCNQFMEQEPGGAEEIASFCQKNYGVTFPISEKLDVKGSAQHPIYRWLCNKSENGALDATVSWNFNKFLINEQGQLIAYYPSGIKPLGPEITQAITK
ncbi:MAG: glutathione peroxidase [Sphingomonadales bacterium]|nr:glutathione peroxidase [Sphingomonadales bacterium]